MLLTHCSSCFNPRTRTGCDLVDGFRNAAEDGFQSTHPHGVRRCKDSGPEKGVGVSIHAPARGATPVYNSSVRFGTGFNPRTRTGCDFGTRWTLKQVTTFQSTHPHGVRPAFFAICWASSIVSIHAPARGATNSFPILMRNGKKFQSTHPHGVRH